MNTKSIKPEWLKQKFEKILDERDLAFGGIHAQGKEIHTNDLQVLNKKASEKAYKLFQSLLSSQARQYREEVGEMKEDTSVISKKDLITTGFGAGWNKALTQVQKQVLKEGF